jgi:magnesium chelatase family protein
VRERVERARAIQAARARTKEVNGRLNATLGAADLARVVSLDLAGEQVLRSAAEALGLSARAFGKVLRVSRTLADLDGQDAVRADHVSEALHLRHLDRVRAAGMHTIAVAG